MGESIYVYTDMIREPHRYCPKCNGFTGLAWVNCQTCGIKTELINPTLAQRTALRELLQDFERVDRDPGTGEILSGGNTFLFLEPI